MSIKHVRTFSNFDIGLSSVCRVLVLGDIFLTYLWNVSSRHGADDKGVSSHMVLGQLGVCRMVKVAGLCC